MKYDVLKLIMKSRFVMLLISLKNCRIDVCEKVDEEVKRSCIIVIVNRDRRENEVNCFDRETISVHDIDFLNVVGEKIDKKIDEKTNEETKEINEKNEANFL